MDEETKVTGFYWFFRKEELRTEVLENGKEITVVDLDISGASRRFLPDRMSSALGYFYTHPEAEGLRSSKVNYLVGNVNVGVFDETPNEEGEVPVMPATFYETDELLDLSEQYPDEFDSQGMSGVYVSTPLRFTAKVDIKSQTVTTDEKVVRKIGMYMMSPEEIRAMSVLRVTNHTPMTSTLSPSPVLNGPLDGRMGAGERQAECQTCSHSFQPQGEENVFDHATCPGHFGHIELAEPVPHVLFAIASNPNSFDSVLNMFCHHCFKIPISDEKRNAITPQIERIHQYSKNPSGVGRIRRRVNDAIKAAKTKDSERGVIMCPHCEKDSPLVTWNLRQRMFLLQPALKQNVGERFYPYANVYLLLQSIPDDTARLMGFDAPSMRPEYMMMKALPVAPNTMRPTQKDFKTGKPMENDLTMMYSKVVRLSNQIREHKQAGRDEGRIQTRGVGDLFTSVAHCYYNQNSSIGMFQPKTVRTKAGRSKKTIRAGILDNVSGYGSKKTIFRRRMNSKVVNNVIRSVITASGDLSINEVGVPMASCMNTFVRVKVTEENIGAMTELVIRGTPSEKRHVQHNKAIVSERYPGAMWIERFGIKSSKFSLNDRVLWNPSSATTTIPGWTAVGEEWLERRNTLPPDITPEAMKREERMFEWEWSMKWREEMYAPEGTNPLNIGDIVARNILHGDYVMFGRQPSLHRQSLNGLRVVPLDQHSISFNPAICVPFNADFDGDQMNIYVPGSEEAMNEIRDKLQLRDNMLHHRMGKLVIGTDHDQTSGVYLLTMKHKSKAGTFNKSLGVGFDSDGVVYFTRSSMMNLFSKVYHKDDNGDMHYITEFGKPDGKARHTTAESYDDNGKLIPSVTTDFGIQTYSGYRCVSLLIPDGVSAKFESGILYNEDGTMMIDEEKDKPIKDTTVILDGEVITGTLDKVFMGKEKGTLAPAIYYRFGYEEGGRQMQKFVDMLCRLGFAAHHAVGYSMGIADCGLPKEYYEDIRAGYDTTSEACEQINIDFAENNLQKYVDSSKYLSGEGGYSKSEKQQILDQNPYQLRQMLIYEAQAPWEDGVVRAVSQIAGSDNAMEIAVRSGGRGKELNIQQMGAAYGQVRISGVLPVRGFQSKGWTSYRTNEDGEVEPIYHETILPRNFSHYPMLGYKIEHPIHNGYAKNSYYTGMEPHEYFMASVAGRRSDMESSSGALQDSGYLANKVRRALESVVVDKMGRTIDLKDDSIISFRAGGDGFRPYSAKMVHRFPDGQVKDDFSVQGPDEDFTLELQPYFFEFSCKHGVPLAMDCDSCVKGSKWIEFLEQEVSKKYNANRLISAVKHVLSGREVMKPVANAMVDKLLWWINENKVQPGEAIGSTAAGCLAEPATQGSLRTFHAGGKGQGTSVTRLEQVVECSDQTDAGKQVFTYVTLKPEYWNESDADRIADWCSVQYIGDILEVVDYDVERGLCIFSVDMKKVRDKSIDLGFVMRQVTRTLKLDSSPSGSLHSPIGEGDTFIIKVNGSSGRELLNMRDYMSLVQVSGLPQGGSTYITRKDGKYGLQIDSAHEQVWDGLVGLLGEFVDVDSIWCDNPKTVEKFLGIEAAMACVSDQLNYQMNAKSGIGDYDYRYVSTIAETMSAKGKLIGLGPKSGNIGTNSVNTFDAMAMEDVKKQLRGGVTIGNISDARSVTGSTITGRPPLVGQELLKYLE